MKPGEAAMARSSPLAEALWILAPFAVFILVLRWLWVDAPVWDDYDAILGLLLRADELRTRSEWLAMIFGQHNEHRIAVTRIVTLLLARTSGEIDFRVLMLIGNLSLLGTFLFVGREFRGEVTAPILGAAAIVMFQGSYYEASLMGSAALPHLGVVFFAFGCQYFALREGRSGAVLAAAFGLLAAASQANGLLALPIAAAGCAIFGRRRRAAILGVLAVLAWWLYFRDYSRPPNHPSPLVALKDPVSTAYLFFVVVGGMLPGPRKSAILGIAIFAGLVWVATRKRMWRDHPVAAMWVAFLLATAAAAAVGRVGLGVFQASRYAIHSTCLLVILGLCLFALARRPGIPATALALAGAVAISLSATLAVWPDIEEYALRARLVREALPAGPDVPVDRFGGAFYPNQDRANQVLALSSERGYYEAPKERIYGSRVSAENVPEASKTTSGNVDTVARSGHRLTVSGWSDITALRPSRTLHAISSPPFRAAGPVAILPRQDISFAFRDPHLLYSGFRVELDYDSDADAAKGAATLCVVAQSPERPPTRLAGLHPYCAAGANPAPRR